MQEGIFRLKVCIPLAFTLSRLVLAVLIFFRVPLPISYCLLWAVLSDVLDGFFARLLRVETTLGTYLDPVADKLFALAFVWYFYEQSAFSFFQLLALFSRDCALILFGVYLVCSRNVKKWRVRSFFFGKVATSLQFLVFCCLVAAYPVPDILWGALGFVGIGSIIELFCRLKHNPISDKVCR